MILNVDGKSGDKALEENVARVYMEVYTRFKSPEFDVAFQELLEEKFELFKKKQASYGPNNISALGYRGIFTRIWDKVQRLRNLLWESKPDTVGESVEDTLGDLAVYSMMTIILLRDQWPPYYDKPLESILSDVPSLNTTFVPELSWADLKSEPHTMKLAMEQYERELREMNKKLVRDE